MNAQKLELKADWPQARRRLAAWWRGELVDRVCLGVVAPREGAALPPAPDRTGLDPAHYYLDADLRLREIERAMAAAAWLGEAFPNASLDLGPGSMALYLGSPAGFAWDTVWYHPWPPAAQGALPEYDEHNPLWVRHQELIAALAQAARGRYLPNLPDLIEGLDILASLRGTSELLYDLVDRPAWVHAAQERLLDLYFRYYDRCYQLCRAEDGGVSFTAFQVWAPGRLAKLQCDFSAMISPAHFAEFVAPYLRRQCQRLDYTVYHLDGPAAIPHLEHLLAIPELHAIQWTPGAGAPDVWHPDWHPLYRRTRQAGKCLLLIGGYDPAAMDQVVRTLGPQGLYLFTHAPSGQAARELLAHAHRHWR